MPLRFLTMLLSLRHAIFALIAVCGLAACATTIATAPHPLLTARHAMVVVHPADSSQQQQARQLLIRGMTSARIGDHERALEFYQEALDLAPDEPAVMSAVASAYDALGGLPSALLYAERAVDLAPENASYWLHWTGLLERDAQDAALAEAVSGMLDRFPNDPTVLHAAIIYHVEHERVDEAVPLASRLAQSHPEQVPWDTLMPRLSAERHAGLYERGLLYQTSARPDDAEPYVRLGRLYLQSDRPSEALDVLEAGQLYAGGNDSLSLLVAEARRATGQVDSEGATPAVLVAEARRLLADAPSPAERQKARRLLNDALAAEPDRPDALALSGRLAYESGDYLVATEQLQRALEHNPRDVAVWELAALAQLAIGNAPAALETLDEALLLFPGNAPLLLARADAHTALDQPEQAEADAQRATGVDVADAATTAEPPAHAYDVNDDTSTPSYDRDVEQPAEDVLLDDLEALTVAGREAYEAGDFPTAAERLHRALKLNPRDVALWEMAVRYQLAAGDAEGALETLDQALMNFPRDPLLMVQRARVHLALGRANVAAGYAQRVLDELGDEAPATFRAEAYVVLGEARLAQGDAARAREAWERALQLTPDDRELRRRIQQL